MFRLFAITPSISDVLFGSPADNLPSYQSLVLGGSVSVPEAD